MLIRKYKLALLTIFTALLVSACATQVQRVDVNKDIDLSGAWNDTDSRLVSETMINDMLERPWYRNYTRKHNNPPAVIVGEIRNLSHEHINVATFVADIERAMINSGKINFVASSTERKEIRAERKDQDINASDATRKAMGQEMGADFMLKGSINTIIDMEGKTQLRYYQVDLTLISLGDNRKVWLGQKKIKKLIKNSRLRF
ncbi:MAG TPA: penicillin-binding protein activator LpoB [Gammaproteobacteria bacterium]|nr:penicillin-binding protein activator LpoB [Gammaproteobacteria bacterium]